MIFPFRRHINPYIAIGIIAVTGIGCVIAIDHAIAAAGTFAEYLDTPY